MVHQKGKLAFAQWTWHDRWVGGGLLPWEETKYIIIWMYIQTGKDFLKEFSMPNLFFTLIIISSTSHNSLHPMLPQTALPSICALELSYRACAYWEHTNFKTACHSIIILLVVTISRIFIHSASSSTYLISGNGLVQHMYSDSQIHTAIPHGHLKQLTSEWWATFVPEDHRDLAPERPHGTGPTELAERWTDSVGRKESSRAELGRISATNCQDVKEQSRQKMSSCISEEVMMEKVRRTLRLRALSKILLI